MSTDHESYAEKVWVTVGIVAFAAALLLLLWSSTQVLLVGFAAILFAAFLNGLSRWVSRRTKLSAHWALAVVVLALLLLGVGGVWFVVPKVAAQADQLSQSLTLSFQKLYAQLERYGWGQWVVAHAPSMSTLDQRADFFARISGIFSATAALTVHVLVVTFLGLYLALSPRVYLHGLVRLFPKRNRERMTEVLGEVGGTLFHWSLGRLLLMAINGSLTTFGLWLLGIPLAFSLGLWTGLLYFVPNIGPIVAGVPAVLIAWTISPATATWVLALYLVVTNLDGYVFTPLVQQRTVELPPPMIIFSQVLFGVLAGPFGLLLATPLAAAALVLVKRLYIEDTLDDHESQPKAVAKGEIPPDEPRPSDLQD